MNHSKISLVVYVPILISNQGGAASETVSCVIDQSCPTTSVRCDGICNLCKNSAPSSCDKMTGMCHGFQKGGLCKTEWKDLGQPNMCSANTSGRIEDDCQVECGVCKSGLVCSSWPTNNTFFDYGCTTGKWMELDRDMDVSQTADCEKLCRDSKIPGCCHLSDAAGCWIRPWGLVTSSNSGSQLSSTNAIQCWEQGMNCNDDIEENHLGAGNEKKRDCPRRYDSVCKVPLKDAPGSVTFVCKHGFWLIATE